MLAPSFRQLFVFVFAWGVVVTGASWLAGGEVTGWTAINALAFSALLGPMFVVHDLAHVAVARLVGLTVHELRFGAGHSIKVWRIGDVEVWWNAIPFGGYVALSASRPRRVLLRCAVTMLAGPAVSIATVVLLLQVVDPTNIGLGTGVALPGMLLWTSAIVAVVNLIPTPGTDSWVLLHMLTRPRQAADELRAATYIFPSERARRARDYDRALEYIEAGLRELPNELTLENSRALLHLDREDHRAAHAAFTSLLARADLVPYHRALLHNNTAWVDLMIGNPESLDEADRYSEIALKESPHTPHFKGTRGAVLIELGRVEDGIKLVQQALAFHTEAAARAGSYCWLAIATNRLGRIDDAKKHLETARQIDARCKLIPRVEQEIRG
jgi:hypothetical protein